MIIYVHFKHVIVLTGSVEIGPSLITNLTLGDALPRATI